MTAGQYSPLLRTRAADAKTPVGCRASGKGAYFIAPPQGLKWMQGRTRPTTTLEKIGAQTFMAHARPEYGIVIALFGVLLALGIPAVRRGQWIIGGLCLGLAVAVGVWILVVFLRSRR